MLTRVAVVSTCLLACGAIVPRVVAEVPDRLPDERIEAALDLGCRRAHPLERHRPHGASHDVVGPLWLSKPREDRPRGVVLPPFLRVYLYGRSRGCGKHDLAKARELATPEIWVVLWRAEEPPSPPGRRQTTSAQKVSQPVAVRLRSDGKWHDPLWTRDRDRWLVSWFNEDWDERTSLAAGFSALDRVGSLHADYTIEHEGRSYLRESVVFSLAAFTDEWWQAAEGGAP